MRPKQERVAEDVWVVRGGIGRTMSVYLIREAGNVTVFDAGVRGMDRDIRALAAELGPIERVVLGHAHADHRGAAPALDAPVFCHPDEASYARHGRGQDYFRFSEMPPHVRLAMPVLLRAWDGGPVTVAGTLDEGDQVAGFEVVHIPGHAPGQIALWRERDRVALTSDAFYALDPFTGLGSAPRLPHGNVNHDQAALRASLEKLAALRPRIAWPGHAGPLTGRVSEVFKRLAG